MNKPIATLMIGLMLTMTGCATYSEGQADGYTAKNSAHQYEQSYSKDQRQHDADRNKTVAERQSEYDRHENAKQARAHKENSEMRKNVVTGIGTAAAIGGAAYTLKRVLDQ